MAADRSNARERATDNSPFAWWRDKVLPYVAVAAICTTAGAVVAILQKIDGVVNTVSIHEQRITANESRVEAVEKGYMSRIEVLESIKRVEQNQQILIQQFKIESLEKGRK